MHKIEFMIRNFVDEAAKGLQCIQDHLAEGFGDECREALYRNFEYHDSEPDPFRLRVSNIGRPLCQLQYEKQGNLQHRIKPVVGLYGDIVEDLMYVLLLEANVPVVAWQEPVEIDVGSTEYLSHDIVEGVWPIKLKPSKKLKGTLDAIIDFGDDPRVWDIKSASGWSFDNKFNKGFDGLFRDDTFGYCDQLFLYAEAKGIKAGGWIIMDKSSGDIKVIEVPDEQESYKKIVQTRVRAKIEILNSDLPIQKQFHLQPEKFQKKFTGRWTLDKPCTWCDHKFDCWTNVRFESNPKSEAKNPPMKWYADYSPKEMKDRLLEEARKK